MKKTFAALALSLLFVAPAFAETTSADVQQPADQAIAQQTQEQAPQVETYSSGKVGRAIGRIVRDIARGELDRRGHRWGRRHRRGGYPPSQVACYAQNRRGDVFQAVGYDTYETQQRAMDQCYSYSVFCAELGCRYY